MTHEAPRHSVVFGLRESYIGTRHYSSVRVNTAHGAFIVPAYSQDSEVLGCSSAGGIFCRRVPSSPFNNGIANAHDGKEMASLRLAGGAAWYPTGNKFYHGAAQIDANDSGLFCVIDPETDIPRRVYVASQDGKTGRRAFWHPANDEIWIAVDTGNSFVRIDPSDDSIVGYVAGVAPNDFTYRASNTSIYLTGIGSGSVFKITSGGVVSTVFDKAAFEAILGGTVTNWFLGKIEFIDSLGIVLFAIQYDYDPGGGLFTFTQFWQLNGSDVPAPFNVAAHGTLPGFMYYTSQFDRLILQNNGVLGSYDASVSVATPTALLGFNGVSTDILRAEKGVYCDNVDAIALPVQTGAPGARFEDVNYYEAADL